jgi:acyl transferase domain-containing protein/NAD(P)-dependent dehydrogenase (short-subunit alcohol dehydrogenase family)
MNANMPNSESSHQPPLAIVGLSALFPKSDDADQFWSNIRQGVDAISEVPATHWNPDDYFDSDPKSPDMTYARRGGFLSPVPFDPLEYGISPNNLEAIDTSQLLGMVAAKRALEHAGYGAGRQFDRSRVGCILGVTGTLEMVIPLGARLGHPKWRAALRDAGVPDDVANDVVQRISESYVPWQENSFPGLLGNVVAGRIANRLDLHGTNCVVDAACASSLSAIHLAALELWTGRSDMVVTGGIDTFNDIFMYMCFSKTPALSASGDAKPFSENADGTILGEGVGIVVLKRLDDAERDGDRIFAVLKGIGTSSDGAGNAVYAPKAEGQIRCLQDAYRVADVSPDTIELVEAHGTGTKVGDATEVSGLLHVFKATGRQGQWCAVGSIKSQIGHTKAAAGAAGIIKAILALQHRVLPPTIKVSQPPAALLAADSPFYVNTEARPWLKPDGYPRRVGVSAFGFGGSNFHCVLEESPQRFDAPDWDGDVQIVALSASSPTQLSGDLQTWIQSDDWNAVRNRAAASRVSFRPEREHRLLFVIERDKTDTSKLVAGALTMLDKYADRTNWSTPDGVYYGRGVPAGQLGVLFPGQGSQYPGMLRELACRFPVMNDVLSEANEVFATRADVAQGANGKKLSDYVYPSPSWTPEDRGLRESELRQTQIAQPAIGAVSLGALAVLELFGVNPEAVAGHSYGELTALCASRRFAPKTLYRLSMLRGRLMAEAQEVDGGMLAVGAPLTQVEAAIREMAVDLVVANYNSPNQVVLSGRIPEIDRATELFSQRNLRGKKLQVAAAFHSPLVATASRAFRPELESVDFAPSRMPVYANSTATEYPADPHAARDLLASQLARPVNFVNEIEQMYADGVRTFLEVGPGGVLTGLVNSILSGREFRAVALDSSNGRRGGVFDLAHALAQLSASGHSIRLDAWDPRIGSTSDSTPSKRLRIPICGANYVKPRTPLPPRPPFASAPTPVVSEPPLSTSTRPNGTNGHSTATESPLPAAPAASVAVPAVAHHPVQESPAPILTAAVQAPSLMTSRPTTDDAASNCFASNCSASNGPDIQPLSSDLQATIQDNLKILQRMQDETARIHLRFLESQESALKTFEELARRQLDLTVRHGVTASPKVASTLTTDSVPITIATPNDDVVTTSAPAARTTPVIAPEPPSNTAATALAKTVLAVVSEKTGYPTEMLNLEMSLDHDLGIDSIKRVEILSALQERVANLPAFKPEELGALHTLLDVVTLAEARSAELNGVSSPSNAPAPTHAQVSPLASQTVAAPAPFTLPVEAARTVASPASTALTETVLAVVSEKTGYPTEMLSLEMSLDHDLGIDSIKRVEILSALQERVANLPAFKPEELGALHTLLDVVTLAEARSAELNGKTSANNAPTPAHAPATPLALQSVAAPAPVPVPSELRHAVPSLASTALTETVLAVVSEKTGYPTEMLSLEMSLDHDLGIDSIKRVEILSALQERVANLPAFKPEELGALHTLQDVVTLAEARSAELNGSSSPSNAPAPTHAQVSPHAPQTVVAPAPLPVPVVAAQTVSSSVPTALTETVLAVVSEKTGYPTEMLSLEMSLDHDLGIDSIKRVEILSALQERVANLPAFKPEELGALHTLQDVVTLAEARSAELNGGSSPVNAPLPASAPSPQLSVGNNSVAGDTVAVSGPGPAAVGDSWCSQPSTLVRSIVQAVSLPPVSSTDELPVVRGAEIWITEDGLELSLRIAAELSQRGFKPRVINLDEPFVSAVPERLAGLIVVAPADGTHDRHLWRAIEWLQKAAPALRRTAATGTCVFATVSRLDGQFGIDARQSLADPLSGGLAGLTKSAAREWPELNCKAIDLSSDWSSASEAAVRVADELFRQGPVEIGLSPTRRCTPKVVDESLDSFRSKPPSVLPGELVIVSGGARGVTAEAALAVAQSWKCRLVILGRSPIPPDEPEWLQRLTTEAQIKQGLMERLPRGTLPKAVEAQYRQILAGREITSTLSRLQAADVPVSYHAVDIRDLAIVRPLLLQLQEEFGPVRGIIHGAGVLADQRIEDKTRDQFDRVYQTKVAGLRNLLGAIRPDELRMLCLFSSYTARYGRVGQSDYAIANEVLNKLARQFSIEHSRSHVVSFNWGPWDGGMVTGGLKKLFAAEQVGLIPLADGASLLVQELSQGTSRPVEILVLGKTDAPNPASPPQVESASNVNLAAAPQPPVRNASSNILVSGNPGTSPAGDPARQPEQLQGSSNVLLSAVPGEQSRATAPAPTPVRPQGSSNVLLAGTIPPPPPAQTPTPNPSGSSVFAEIGQATSNEPGELKIAFEKTLDVKQYPFLESHVIGGKAVLPVAIILEWLSHGAIHHNPGLELEGFDDFRIFHGVRLDRHGSAALRVMVGRTARADGRFVVRTQLVGHSDGRDIVHAAGTVILASHYSASPDPRLQIARQGYSLDMATAYSTKLFHGTHLQGIAAVEACSSDGIAVDSRTSPAPWAWMCEPLRSAWITDPLSIDAALQAVILWSQEIQGIPCLPCSMTGYRQFRKVFPHTGVKIVVKVTHATEHTIRADVEFLDLEGMVVATMTGCESIADASLAAAFKRNRLD